MEDTKQLDNEDTSGSRINNNNNSNSNNSNETDRLEKGIFSSVETSASEEDNNNNSNNNNNLTNNDSNIKKSLLTDALKQTKQHSGSVAPKPNYEHNQKSIYNYRKQTMLQGSSDTIPFNSNNSSNNTNNNESNSYGSPQWRFASPSGRIKQTTVSNTTPQVNLPPWVPLDPAITDDLNNNNSSNNNNRTDNEYHSSKLKSDYMFNAGAFSPPRAMVFSLPLPPQHHHIQNRSNNNNHNNNNLPTVVVSSINNTNNQTYPNRDDQLSPRAVVRKQTLIEKFKEVITKNISNSNNQNQNDNNNNQYSSNGTALNPELKQHQQQQELNNNDNNSNNGIGKETYDIIKIFNLPSSEALLSAHPCAYRRKISKAGRLYITNSYICFYSLIYHSEIKKIFAFTDVKSIKKVSSILIGNSIEITTFQMKKYVFGMFENRDTAFVSLMGQYNYHLNSIQSLADVKPITLIIPIGTELQNGADKQPIEIIKGRERFKSVSVSSRAEMVRARSGSLPAYPNPNLLSPNEKKSKHKSKQINIDILSPVKESVIQEEEEESVKRSNSPPSIIPHQVKQIQNNNNNNNNSPTMYKRKNSSPSISPPVLSPLASPRGRKDTIFTSNNIFQSFSSSSNNLETTFNGTSNNNNYSINTSTNNFIMPLSPNSNLPPLIPIQRERSSTLFGQLKSRVKITTVKNKESLDRINTMLKTRGTSESAHQYLKEEVFGVVLEEIRLSDDCPVPSFIMKLLNYIEELDNPQEVKVDEEEKDKEIETTLLDDEKKEEQAEQIEQLPDINTMSIREEVKRQVTEDEPNIENKEEEKEQEEKPSILESTYLSDLIMEPEQSHHLEVLIKSTTAIKEDYYKLLKSPPLAIVQLLLYFLTRIPVPLLNEELLACIDITDPDYRLSCIRSIIYTQTQIHWTTFKTLVNHLTKLVDTHLQKQERKQATPTNLRGNDQSKLNIYRRLAGILGPILIRTTNEVDFLKSIQLLYFILENQQYLLNENCEKTQYVFKKGKQLIKTITIDQLLVKLTDVYYKDDGLLETFNLTHHDYFISSPDYIKYLVQTYSNSMGGEYWKCRLRERILFLLKSLIEFKPLFWVTPEGSECIQLIQVFAKEFIGKGAPHDENKQLIFLDDYTKILTLDQQQQQLRTSGNSVITTSDADSNPTSPTISPFASPVVTPVGSPSISPINSNTINSGNNSGNTTPTSTTPTVNGNFNPIGSPRHRPSQNHKNDFILSASRTLDAKKFQITELDPTEIATQITLIDEKTFRQLPVSEFLKQRFTKVDQSLHFQSIVQLFNRWSSWVGSEILTMPLPATRALCIEQFIEIAQILLNLKNYHACYAITTGLSHYAIKRLHSTWDRVSKKSMIQLQALQKVFATDSNHKQYRDLLVMGKPPLIPYVGLYTKDLFVVTDAQPTLIKKDMISESSGGLVLVNFEKMRQIHSVIKNWKLYRQIPYPMKQIQSLQGKIMARSILNDDELYEKSLLFEPKQAQSNNAHNQSQNSLAQSLN